MADASQPAAASLKERWFAFRNAKLADPRFQRWAATFPLTRRIAARRAKGLFDICAGFVYSQVLFAAVRLELFEALRAGPVTVEALAEKLGMPASRLTPLLGAAQALGLVERRPGATFGLGVHGAAFLGNPAIRPMIEHHALLYQDLEDPVALLRGEKPDTALSAFWPYAGAAEPHAASADAVAPYGAIMSETQGLIADDVLDAYPIEGHRRLLDVGGGEGAFLLAAAKRHPGLSLVLFDLPAVVTRAADRLNEAQLANHFETVGGDFGRDALPQGADLIALVRVIHDHDDASAAALLAKVFDALPPGGVLLLAEPMAAVRGAETVEAYFAFYLLAMGQGRPRTARELQAFLYQAGFARVREVATARPLLTSLFIAQKSAGPANRHVNLD